MNKDNPISLSDVKVIYNLCKKIQNDLDKKKSYLMKDQNKLMELLDRFKGKYPFLHENQIVLIYPIPEVVKVRLRLI